MLRLGLCCIFHEQPIKFCRTTAAAASRRSRDEVLRQLSRLCLDNAAALSQAVQFCARKGIGCFRVVSQILPLKTHPLHGYEVEDLPEGDAIREQFLRVGALAAQHDVRLSFHPDQFVVLNSQREEVVTASLRELEYQAEVAEWIGADVINIHAGGAFGDKQQALTLLARNLAKLSDRARSRLTLENDDRLFTCQDLLPACHAEGVPLVYDVHHHRCNPDLLSVQEATEQAMGTWSREPLFHISSPLEGWAGPGPRRHHDFIDIRDFPSCWHGVTLTVEVEAKAKEVAVTKLKRQLARRSATMRNAKGGRMHRA